MLQHLPCIASSLDSNQYYVANFPEATYADWAITELQTTNHRTLNSLLITQQDSNSDHSDDAI